MKNLLNKLSVWQRIFIILSFGYLILVICLWYTEGKEYRERQMKETELLIERDQTSTDKARLIEIYELISGYDSERNDYAPGSINLSNLFEWLLIGNEESNKAIEERYPGSEILKPNVIENPDGRFTIVYDYAGKPKGVIEDGKLTLVYDSDSSQMGVVELLEYYVKQFSFPSDEHDWRRRAELAISQYKKDFDFSDIENRYKTTIHNNEQLRQQKSKELRPHIYVVMPVMYYLLWIVPVALAYGLCLGIRKLNKLSGWHRIFLVYACTNLVIVVFICVFMPEIVKSSRRSLNAEDVIGFIFKFGIIPIGLIYVLGRGAGWALRGFRKDKDK